MAIWNSLLEEAAAPMKHPDESDAEFKQRLKLQLAEQDRDEWKARAEKAEAESLHWQILAGNLTGIASQAETERGRYRAALRDLDWLSPHDRRNQVPRWFARHNIDPAELGDDKGSETIPDKEG